MDCRFLLLVIQSAQGLKDVSYVRTMQPYALVSIRDNQNNLHSSEEKIPEATVGGSNPTWNSPPVTFNLDITKAKESSLELVVKLMDFRKNYWFRDKEIGEVRVVITKLLEDFGGKAKADAVVAEKQMSASVMTTDKKPQGTLVFSYKFESVITVQKPARQKNFPTAQQNVQQNPQQPAGLGNPLISKTVKGNVGTALNNTGLTQQASHLMDCRFLLLVIESAQGLKDVSHLTPLKPYALVSIRDNQNNLHSSEEQTQGDAVGGSNPKWNSPVTFNLDITKAKESNLELVVKLMDFGKDHWLRGKEIGEVRLFITKLLEDFGGKAKADAVVAEKQMSASVMTTDEKPQGTLVFSYKFESGSTTVQKPARQKNSPTAQQNVQQNPQQSAGLGNPLNSKAMKGIVGTASNNSGLTQQASHLMDCRVLKLVIQSAHGLKDVSHVTPMKPYALVSLRDKQNNLHSSEEQTPEDAVGGSNPKWNSPVTFNLDITKAKESNLELVVKLMDFRKDYWFRDKEIGEVRLFITKLLEDFGGKAKADAVVAEKQMSASVMTTDEKPQGTLVFSYKFESVTTVQKPTRQKNSPTAQQNVQQNPQQSTGLGNPLNSKAMKGIVGTASNNIGLKSAVASTGLTSAVASDATAARPLPAFQTRDAAAADQRGTADDPSEDNNGGIAGTALNTTGLTSGFDATAPSEDNNAEDEAGDYGDEGDEDQE